MVLVERKVLQSVLLVLKDLFVEDVVDVGREVGAKVPRNENSALFVKYVDR